MSVEVATVDHALHKICRKYRKTRRKPKGLKRLWAHLLNTPHIALIITAVVFVVVVVMWSLLWVFVCKSTLHHTMQHAQQHRDPPIPPTDSPQGEQQWGLFRRDVSSGTRGVHP